MACSEIMKQTENIYLDSKQEHRGSYKYRSCQAKAQIENTLFLEKVADAQEPKS